MVRCLCLWLLLGSAVITSAAEPASPSIDAAALRAKAQQFHRDSQQRTGILIPLYLYPADIHTNPAYNRLIDLKRRYETVPFWVIVNPDSGPGKNVDPNYTKAIDRLLGAGCVVLGYVRTDYGKQPAKQVQANLDLWRKLYPRAQGIFFDEMMNEDTDAAVAHQVLLNKSAADRGYWPTVANPGTDTPGRYFAANAADVIVVHEADSWPTEAKMKGDYFGGYSDYPPWTRAILLHSQPKLDLTQFATHRKYARWLYMTEDEYRVNDPKADNPWDSLSKYMEVMCEQLAKP